MYCKYQSPLLYILLQIIIYISQVSFNHQKLKFNLSWLECNELLS